MHLSAAHTKAAVFARGITFPSRVQAQCGLAAERFLGVEMKEGSSHEKPIDHTHKADQWLKPFNLIVEIHPIVLEHALERVTLKILQECLKRLPVGMGGLLVEGLRAEKAADYYRQRRHWLNISPSEEMRKSRLIVATSTDDYYKKVVRPHALEKVTFEDFNDFVNRI